MSEFVLFINCFNFSIIYFPRVINVIANNSDLNDKKHETTCYCL